MKLACATAAMLAAVWGNPACPTATEAKSSRTGEKAELLVMNDAQAPVELYWVNWKGEESLILSLLDTGSETERSSFTGHVFRARSFDGTLVSEKTVLHKDKDVWPIQACGDIKPRDITDGREEEFKSLIDPFPTKCEGESKDWSCLKFLTQDDLDARNPDEYGFNAAEARGQRKKGDTIDEGYTDHIPLIPHLTKHGFLKLNFTQKMKDVLLPFYEAHREKATVHEPVGGDYSNIHKVGMHKLNLDMYQEPKKEIVEEMKQVLQWWTRRRLRHTSTFGIRIYHRESMLVNHVDRADTHLASAVIQVAQAGVEKGWPLELITPEGTIVEVYLQPGEMVLYEGARLFHGRPMRFQGEDFANLFSHFAPVTWKAVGKPWDDPAKELDVEAGPMHPEL